MLELPEAINMAKQLDSTVKGKLVSRVLPPTKEHKFCWYNGDPARYSPCIEGRYLSSADSFGMFAEIGFDNGQMLCINDGVNVRLTQESSLPKHYQLAICFSDGAALSFTVAMYGGICLHESDYDNGYYIRNREAISPLSPKIEEYYYRLLEESKPTLSAKAFLATEQRFPGIGNGVLQDILFAAHIHPKRKISTLSHSERYALLEGMRLKLKEMLDGGGRDTEKDLFGNPGGYSTKMSKNTLATGCPMCGGSITKEAYLGGSVYYCPKCQPLLV